MKKQIRILAVVLLISLMCTTAFSASTRVNGEYVNEFYNFMSKLYYKQVYSDDLFGGSLNGLLKNESVYSSYEQKKEESGESYSIIGASLEKVRTGLLVSSVNHGSNAFEIGLETGDIIYRINRISTSILNADDLDYAINKAGGTALLEVIKKDSGKVVTYEGELNKGYYSEVDFFINDGIGYIRINDFTNKTADYVKSAIMFFDNNLASDIILDVRDTISMNIEEAVKIIDNFLPYGRVASSNSSVYSVQFKKTYHKVNVIINENTTGAGEVIARAVKNYKTGIVYGATSYGLVEDVKTYPVLSDNVFTYYSEKANTTDILEILTYLNKNSIEILPEHISGELHISEGVLVDNYNKTYSNGVVPDYTISMDRYISNVNVMDKGIWVRQDYKIGDLSYDVFLAEKILKELGYFNATPDVTYDSVTADAVNKYKSDINMEEDSIFDMTTQKILNYSLIKDEIIKDECIIEVIKIIKEQ